MKAKHVSIWWSKIGSIIFVVGMFALKAVFAWKIGLKEIIGGGAFIFVVGLPVDVSFWIDKVNEVVKAKGGVGGNPSASGSVPGLVDSRAFCKNS